jgi:hypothetical protein
MLRFLPVLLLAAFASGCVERLLQVKTNTPRASVYVNGDPVGVTGEDGNLDHPFTYYGTVDVTVRAPGYLSDRKFVEMSPPWYQLFPIDYVAELLVPVTIRDTHEVALRLIESPKTVDESERRDLETKTEALKAKLPAGRGCSRAGSSPCRPSTAGR